MKITIHHFHHRNEDIELLRREIQQMLGNLETRIMSNFDDLKAAQAATDALITKVSGDIATLLGKLANIPPGGLTPEQQAALDDAVAHANAINASLTAADTSANPPA